VTGKSTLDPDNRAVNERPHAPPGHDARSLGPSDSSDSGSDLAGVSETDADTDRYGTGEGPTARKSPARPERDVGPDRIVDADDAGLGDGADQVEEALGKANEEDAEGNRGK
jgi:hypothetical protein